MSSKKTKNHLKDSFKKKMKLSPETLKDIDKALGHFFFGCNIPFNVVESNYFKNFVASLIPPEVYSPPTRKTLSTTILDQIYNEVVAEKVSFGNTEAVLLIDGWKNSSANKQNVVCTLNTAGGKSLFLHSWDMTGICETANELKKIVDEAIIMAKENFNIHVYAVVSDNASPMILMGKKIDIWHTGCNSHSGNLLAKSLVPQDYATKINKILRSFRNAGPEKELKKRGGSRVILGCETRWCSYRDSFKSLLKNLPIMLQLVKEKLVVIDAESTKLIQSPSLETEVLDFILIYDPICELINICQKSQTSIADACEAWLKIVILTNNNNYEEILGKRLKKVLTPILLAANLLHPKYRGRQFKNDDQLLQAIEFIEIELTADNSTNNDSINILLQLGQKIQPDLENIKLVLKKGLDTDSSGSISKAVNFYKETIQLLSTVIAIKTSEEEINELKVLKEKIKYRVDQLQVMINNLGLNNYLNNLKIFDKLKTYESSVAFWTAAGPSHSKLANLARKLHKIPSSSAQLERLFSCWAYIHSDLRNRLSVERSMKLIDVYYFLKMKEISEEHHDNFLEY